MILGLWYGSVSCSTSVHDHASERSFLLRRKQTCRFRGEISLVYIAVWPRGLRRVSATAHLLGSCVRIPPATWMFVSFECRVCFLVEVSATGRSLVQRSPTECGVSNFDLETSTMRRSRPARALEP